MNASLNATNICTAAAAGDLLELRWYFCHSTVVEAFHSCCQTCMHIENGERVLEILGQSGAEREFRKR